MNTTLLKRSLPERPLLTMVPAENAGARPVLSHWNAT
jgi:hypothetical protein